MQARHVAWAGGRAPAAKPGGRLQHRVTAAGLRHSTAAAGTVAAVAVPRRQRRQLPLLVAATRNEPHGSEDEQGRGEEAVERFRGPGRGEEEPARTMALIDENPPSETIMQREDEEMRAAGAVVAGRGGAAEEQEDEEMRNTAGAEVAGGGRGAASEPERAAAAPPPPSGASAPAGSQGAKVSLRTLLTDLADLPAKVDALAGLPAKVDALTGRVGALSKQQAAFGKTLGGISERLVCVERVVGGHDLHLRRNELLSSVDDVLRACSLPGFLASKQLLVKGLVATHGAFLSLRRLVLPQLQAEADKRGVQLPDFPEPIDSWKAEGARWQQARQVLLAARPKRSGKASWMPALMALQNYASAAARRRLPSYLLDPKQGQLVLMLLAALAANRQLESLEFDAAPVLALQLTEQGTTLVLYLVEIKTSPSAINEGAEQLEVQARILAFVLANANSKLLKAHGPLQVVGTVEMAGSTPSPAQRQH